jgi:hypothetical protein
MTVADREAGTAPVSIQLPPARRTAWLMRNEPRLAQDALIALWLAFEMAHGWRRLKAWFDFD